MRHRDEISDYSSSLNSTGFDLRNKSVIRTKKGSHGVKLFTVVGNESTNPTLGTVVKTNWRERVLGVG